MLEAVIFDFDGVIVDTPGIYFKHMKKLLQKYHADISNEDVSNLVGRHFEEELDYINKKYGLNISLYEFVAETINSAKEDFAKLVLDPCLKNLLVELSQFGVKLAIASNGPKSNIDFIVSRLGVGKYFSVIISGDDVENYKPFPDVYLAAVERLGVSKRNCVAVEDTLIGLKSAQSAGLKVVVIPNEFTVFSDFSGASLVAKGFNGLTYKVLNGLVE